jgi:hypothetical protein
MHWPHPFVTPAQIVPSIPPREVREETAVAKDDIEPDDIEEEIDLEGEDLEEGEFEDGEFDDDSESPDDEDDDESVGATVVRKPGDDDDDDEDMLAPDDVEADLDTILKDRLASENPPDEEDEEVETDDRGSGEESLQPKRADEELCSSCFLLVRRGAPVCPVGDDACPMFAK